MKAPPPKKLKEAPKGKQRDRLFERYKLVIQARNFHYDNFNKWLTYFYVANAGIFLGYIQVLGMKESDVAINRGDSILAVLLFGWLAGILLFWSSKGYYYWNINFISMVNHYETKVFKWPVNQRVYAAMADKSCSNKYWSPIDGANYSTSKIAILFAFCIAVGWGGLVFYHLDHVYNVLTISWEFRVLLSLVTSGAIVFGLGQIIGKREKTNRAQPRSDDKNWLLASNTNILDELNLPDHNKD